jgi:hypothetical protein
MTAFEPAPMNRASDRRPLQCHLVRAKPSGSGGVDRFVAALFATTVPGAACMLS